MMNPAWKVLQWRVSSAKYRDEGDAHNRQHERKAESCLECVECTAKKVVRWDERGCAQASPFLVIIRILGDSAVANIAPFHSHQGADDGEPAVGDGEEEKTDAGAYHGAGTVWGPAIKPEGVHEWGEVEDGHHGPVQGRSVAHSGSRTEESQCRSCEQRDGRWEQGDGDDAIRNHILK